MIRQAIAWSASDEARGEKRRKEGREREDGDSLFTQSMLVTAAHECVVTVKVSQRQEIRMLEKESQAEPVVSQILIQSTDERTEDVPDLIIPGILSEEGIGCKGTTRQTA